MKRDFQEEYQNYIESDMPDLWSRIEPNLKEKNGKSETGEQTGTEESGEKAEIREKDSGKKIAVKQRSKALYFIKRAVPAAACLCALVIGISVMRISKSNSADKSLLESASEESADGGMAYEAAPAEAPLKNTETDNDEEVLLAEDVQNDTAKAEAAGGTDMPRAQAEMAGEMTADTEEAVEIERAVLYKIAVASEEMQEMGYAYAYSFRLEDGSSLKVYLTKDQCDDIENREIEIKRKEAYSLSVYPFKGAEIGGNAQNGEGILKKIVKLP